VRDSVFRLISDDPTLNAAPFNIDEDCVFPTFAMDGTRTVPSPNNKLFVIIRWETTPPGPAAVTTFSVWVHQPLELGDSFNNINAALERIRNILQAAVHVPGADGKKLTQANFQGYGGDQYDGGYNTITKYAAFRGLSGESFIG
jgi:hypothetical protein